MKQKTMMVFLWLVIFLPLVTTVFPQETAGVKIEKVAGNVYCLSGQGGNIGILAGEKELLLVDAQFDRTGKLILEKIKGQFNLPITYLINTHYHSDHTSGNAIIGKGAIIISHVNCLQSLKKSVKPGEQPDPGKFPQKTFTDKMQLKVGAEDVELYHWGGAHTAGDTIIIFPQSGVVHTGDLFFSGVPPYIDVEDGADTENWIKIIRRLMDAYPNFKVIPGHGPVTDMKALGKQAEYLSYLRQEVIKLIKEGKSRQQVIDGIDLSNYILKESSFLSKKENVGWIFDEIIKRCKSE